jgi:hypothetical protein
MSKFSKNHNYVNSKALVKEIILTTNELVTFGNLSKLTIVKGAKPWSNKYKEGECKCIELVQRKRKRSNVYESYKSQAISANGIEDNNNELFG